MMRFNRVFWSFYNKIPVRYLLNTRFGKSRHYTFLLAAIFNIWTQHSIGHIVMKSNFFTIRTKLIIFSNNLYIKLYIIYKWFRISHRNFDLYYVSPIRAVGPTSWATLGLMHSYCDCCLSACVDAKIMSCPTHLPTSRGYRGHLKPFLTLAIWGRACHCFFLPYLAYTDSDFWMTVEFKRILKGQDVA
jgi:hypothetical protein